MKKNEQRCRDPLEHQVYEHTHMMVVPEGEEKKKFFWKQNS